jgi:hypothetical protein
MNECAYLLHQKVICSKHPSKTVEYFCIDPECADNLGLYCPSCIFKKEFCRHESILDISEFLYDIKQSFDKKGLNDYPEILDYYMSIQQHEVDYQECAKTEYAKFEAYSNQICQKIIQTFEQLKIQIRTQLEEHNQNFQYCSKQLAQKVADNYNKTTLSKFASFEEATQSFNTTTEKGL